MPQTLYSIRTHIPASGSDSYFITKFVDGEVESSYITTREACNCPAGVRSTCRHRQMLPHMLGAGIVNTHWFLTWPEAQVVDFQGTLRRNLEQVLEGIEGVTPDDAAAEVDLTDIREEAQFYSQPKPEHKHHWADHGAADARDAMQPTPSWRRF